MQNYFSPISVKTKEALAHTNRDVKMLLWGDFFLGFGFSGFSLILNLYLKAIGFGESNIGQWLSLRNYAMLFIMIPAALFIKKLNIKWVMLVSTIFTVVGSLLVILMPSTAFISSGMIILGVFAAFASIVAGPMIMKGTSFNYRTFLFSINFSLMLASGILGNMLGGFLPDILQKFNFSEISGYKYSLLMHVFIMLLGLVPFWFIEMTHIAENEDKGFFKIKTPINLLCKLALPNLLVGLGAGLTIPFLNLYFKDRFAVSSSRLGLLFSVAQILMILGAMAAPHLSEKSSKIKVVILSQMLSVPFLFILAVSFNVWISAVAFFARATLMNMAQPLATNFAMEMADESDHALVSGVMTIAWLATWGVSANVGGYLIEKYGYFIPFNLTLLAYVISSVVYFLVHLRMENKLGYGARETGNA